MSEAIKHGTDTTLQAQALQPATPALVDSWAEWCGPCRLIAPLLEEWAQSYAGRRTVAKVNVDENAKLPSQYHVRSIPTLMLFRDGKPVATQVGALSKAQLTAFIENNL